MAIEQLRDNRIPLVTGQRDLVHPLLRNVSGQAYKLTLADDATFNFGDLDNFDQQGPIGLLVSHIGSADTEAAIFMIDPVGESVVVLIEIVADNFAVAQTDGDVCLYVSSGSLIFENKYGASADFTLKRIW